MILGLIGEAGQFGALDMHRLPMTEVARWMRRAVEIFGARIMQVTLSRDPIWPSVPLAVWTREGIAPSAFIDVVIQEIAFYHRRRAS